MAATLEASPSTIQMRLSTGIAIAGTPDQAWSLIGNNDSSILTTSPQINIDGSLLHFGVGAEAPTDGLVHIHGSSAGSVTANAAADDLVVESSATSLGMSFLGITTSTEFVIFGDTDASAQSWIQYSHSNDVLSFHLLSGALQPLTLKSNGVVVNETSNSSTDLRVESDTNENAFLVDASNGSCHFQIPLFLERDRGMLFYQTIQL